MSRPKKSNVGNGFEKKVRTIEQVTQDYNQECFMVGHKSRLLKQYSEDVVKLEDEIKEHLESIVRCNAEGMKLQAALKMAQPQVGPAPEQSEQQSTTETREDAQQSQSQPA